MHSQGRGLSQDGGCEPQGKDKDENKNGGHHLAEAIAKTGRRLSHHERKLAQAAAVAAVGGRKLSQAGVAGRGSRFPEQQRRQRRQSI